MNEVSARRTNLPVRDRAKASAHRQAVQVTDQDLAAALTEKLGARIVAFMVNRDKSTISRWASGAKMPSEASQSLRTVYQIFKMLEAVESDHTIRAWFIGMNPQLDDESPAEAVRAGNLRDVLEAARAFEVGG